MENLLVYLQKHDYNHYLLEKQIPPLVRSEEPSMTEAPKTGNVFEPELLKGEEDNLGDELINEDLSEHPNRGIEPKFDSFVI
jgi:hypothetical protein